MVIALIGLVAALVGPLTASAWLGDFFEGRTSGQAVFEDMAIHPQAVRVGTWTYVVYQGAELDPYIMAFSDDGTSTQGPFRIGDNPLTGGHVYPFDSHGAPAIAYFPNEDRFLVMWGAHSDPLRYASARRDDIAHWSAAASATRLGDATYPQLVMRAGAVDIYYRCSWSGSVAGTLTPVWARATSTDVGSTWTTPTPVLLAGTDYGWYAHFEPARDGWAHMVATVRQDLNDTSPAAPLKRSGVYYAEYDPVNDRWRDATGSEIATGGGVSLDTLSAPACTVSARVPSGGYQNSVTVADDGSGGPGLLWVGGTATSGPDALQWRFARFSGGAWQQTAITSTDFIMDSAALEYDPDHAGRIDAYLTAAGTPAWTPVDPYDFRGGSLQHWRSDDSGASWSLATTIKTADPDVGVTYNDPQIVLRTDGDAAGPHLLFGEWDNDAGAMVHKLYLWTPTPESKGTLFGRTFFPQITRLWGGSRYDTAVAISHASFDAGSEYVIVASGEGFADALAGGSLAEAYRAPLLLVNRKEAPRSVRDEITRLNARHVIVLGGTAVIPDTVKRQLDIHNVRDVVRIAGANRYATAAAIADAVVARKGVRGVAFVASGESFADALSASGVAAARGLPVLLVQAGALPGETSAAFARLGITKTIVAGGPAVIGDGVLAQLPAPLRVWGKDRYATSAAIARLGLDGRAGYLAKTLRTDRIIVASGLTFPDALAGAALSARTRGPMVLTKSTEVSPAADALLKERAYGVLNCYLLGGEVALSPGVGAGVATILYGRQNVDPAPAP